MLDIQEPKTVKDENASSSKSAALPKGATPPASSKGVPAPATGPITEDEIRAVLLPKTPVTTKDLLAKFKSRLKTKEVNIFKELIKIKLFDYRSRFAYALICLCCNMCGLVQEKDAFSAIMKRISKILKTNGQATNLVVLR